MDSSSIVNKLYAELQRQENQIDAWSRSQKEEVQRSQRQHIDFAKEADTKIKLLHKNEKKLLSVIDKNRKDEEKENQDLENVQKQIYRLKEQLDSLPEKVEQLSRDTKREESILETKKMELERSENNKRLRMKEYTQGISFYQQLLGLEFERLGGDTRLRLVFTKLDPDSPAREFYFTMALEDEFYQVDDIHPHVPELPKLLEQLNKSNDLSAFVVAIRKEFKKMIRKN